MRVLWLLPLLGACRTATVGVPDFRESAQAIQDVLDAQEAAWNRGDIRGYMEGYLESDTLTFAGGDQITRGWGNILARYQKRYDTKEKMGTLSFQDVEIAALSPNAAFVLGRWALERESDRPHGVFSVVFRKTEAGWRIVHDHSSAASP